VLFDQAFALGFPGLSQDLLGHLIWWLGWCLRWWLAW
jgi:hypothetical protein